MPHRSPIHSLLLLFILFALPSTLLAQAKNQQANQGTKQSKPIFIQLEIDSVVIEKTKSKGESWDPLKGLPDVFTQVLVNQEIFKILPVKKNTLIASYEDAFTRPFKYIKGETQVQVKVFDRDLKDDDFIGLITPTIELTVDRPTQTLHLRGGRIKKMTINVKLDPSFVSKTMASTVNDLELQLNALNTQIEAARDREKAINERAAATLAMMEFAEAQARVAQMRSQTLELKAKGAKQETLESQKAVKAANESLLKAEQDLKKVAQAVKLKEEKAAASEKRAQSAEERANSAEKKARSAEAQVRDQEGRLNALEGELKRMQEALEKTKKLNEEKMKRANRRIKELKDPPKNPPSR